MPRPHRWTARLRVEASLCSFFQAGTVSLSQQVLNFLWIAIGLFGTHVSMLQVYTDVTQMTDLFEFYFDKSFRQFMLGNQG